MCNFFLRDVSSELFLRLLEILKEKQHCFFFVVEVNGVCERNVTVFCCCLEPGRVTWMFTGIQNLAIIVKESGVTSQRKLLAEEVCQASG